jgi:hypothetical protein
MKIAIWDIDNCLADDRHRLHLIDWGKEGDERYLRYNQRMRLDPVAHQDVFNVMRAIGCRPVFFTGRCEKFRIDTVGYLQEKLGVSFPEVHMRPNGTVGLTPAKLKERMLRDLLAVTSSADVVAAFDDLQSVVDMYRAYGIPGVLLKIAEPEAYDAVDLVGVTR